MWVLGYWALGRSLANNSTLCLSSSSLAACLKPPTQSKADWYNFTGANARRSKPDQSEITEPRSLPSLAGATERPSGKPDGLSNYRINSGEGCQQGLVGSPQRAARKYADPSSIMATNWQRFGVGLSTGPAVEAILASTPIPGIFPPAEIEGEP